MKKFFSESIESTVAALETNISSGLSQQEVSVRIERHGENRLEGKKERTMLQMFLSQFTDFLVIILIIAAALSIGLGEVLDGAIILAIVIMNAILGVTQENKASNALKALKEMASPLAKVLRGGEILQVASHLIVPGDVVVLEAGDYVPADLRLIESVNLKIDEAALTGESVPVDKKSGEIVSEEAGIGDRLNSAFMGTVVTYGRGRGIATGTGMQTEIGSIASMLNETTEDTTPLQKKLNSLGKFLGIICIVVCFVIFGLGLMRGMEIFDIFMTSVSLAVAAIPEGLTVVVTVILAMGMQRMVKSNAIIKKLSAVEALGSTTVICSDKTGTLTQNKMTVVKLYDGRAFYDVTGTGYSVSGEIVPSEAGTVSSNIVKLIEGAVLCNDAKYNVSQEKIIGDPTEGALVVVGHKLGKIQEDLNNQYPRVNELPFDSDRKLMSTFHNYQGHVEMYTKGAPDEILRRAAYIYENDEIRPILKEDRERISAANVHFANDALRVLGVAFRSLTEAQAPEEELVFIGLLGMIDPPRDEARDAVSICKRAGIKVKMITGDHKITAGAIGQALGIIEGGAEAIDGKEIDSLSEEQLQEKVKTVSVFARVSPEHKVRLVTAIRNNGNIVAMTGDGVNDAPSLKRADIGIAMGITGTDVSKEAADMILTDDNFASIVKAVEEGRTIYNNIRKVVGYLLSCNIGEILVILFAMLGQLPVPLVPIQLLSINLITDAFPAFALGMEEKEDGIMDVPPRDPKEAIVDSRMRIAIAIQSIFLAGSSLASYIVGRQIHGDVMGTTFCFVTLVFGELLRAYSSRSEIKYLFTMKVFANGFLNKCVLASLIFLLITVYVPFLNPVFNTEILTLPQLLLSMLFAVLPMLGGELAKFVTKQAG